MSYFSSEHVKPNSKDIRVLRINSLAKNNKNVSLMPVEVESQNNDYTPKKYTKHKAPIISEKLGIKFL